MSERKDMAKSFMALLCNKKKKDKTSHLVHADGNVQIFDKPVTAGKIIEEFPHHSVCHSGALYIGQKTTALSPNEQLKVGNKYFLMPEQLFTSALTLPSLASLISPPSQNVSSSLRRIERASALCNPFEIERNDEGGGHRIRVSTEFVTNLMEDGRLNLDGRGHAVESRLCNTPELQKAYEKLVPSRGQSWRPKLETIKENEKVGFYHKMKKVGKSLSRLVDHL